MEATVNSNLSFLVAEIFVFLNYSKIVLLRQENIRIMLAVLLLEKGQKLCSIPQIMPKIMLAQSARAYWPLSRDDIFQIQVSSADGNFEFFSFSAYFSSSFLF